MTNKQIEIAIWKSIAHWHENLDMLMLNYWNKEPLYLDIFIDTNHCPLCSLFYTEKYYICPRCNQCPLDKNKNNCTKHDSTYAAVAQWKLKSYMTTPDLYSHYYKLGYITISNMINALYKILPMSTITKPAWRWKLRPEDLRNILRVRIPQV